MLIKSACFFLVLVMCFTVSSSLGQERRLANAISSITH